MATSSISEYSSGLMWNNVWRQPLRPSTTSPSFFPCRSLNSNLDQVPSRKTRYQLDTLLPGRNYFSLPSTPPEPDESIGKRLESKGDRMRNIQREISFIDQEKAAQGDQNGNRFLPEWYIEPCAEFMNLPSSQDKILSNPKAKPLDHPQKRETYLLDSSYDEDCDFSDRSQCLDFEDCSIVNPSSGEVSKLNSLGQGQSRLMSLFSSIGNESSCSSSSSISEGLDEQDTERSTASVTECTSSDDCLHDSEMASGIEEVRKGLARLLSIPVDSSLLDQQMNSEYQTENLPEQLTSLSSANCGSRLIKLFPSSIPRPEEETDWEQGSPLGIDILWKSDSSSANSQSHVSSQLSSMKNSPTALSPEREAPLPISVKVPNITSISPTAPLHFETTPSVQMFEGFPNPNESAQNSAVNTSFYTACDLSNEETEIEAALERGDGFFTNDDHLPKENGHMNDAIWSPSIVSAGYDHFEDTLESDNADQRAFRQFAESAASDIMDWLDIWLSQCTESNFNSKLTDDWNTNDLTPNFGAERAQNGDETSGVDTTAMNFYAMFDAAATDRTWQRIMNLGDNDVSSGPAYEEQEVYAQLTQSPGILDFLVERDNQERENLERDSVQTQFPGSSLHFMLNSRASDIYDSYLLFPELMHFTHPLKNRGGSDCKELNESSLFSHLFSSSFDWMGSLDVLDPVHHNVWDHTLQSLSPKTPFTPTGNLNDSLHSFERKHSITLEQLCNLATVASSMESVGLDHSSVLSTDFFFQYMQSQLGCFENIAFFNSPSLKKELLEESSRNSSEDSAKLYRPIPLFPFQFVNRLSLTNSDHVQEKNLLVSPTTHFRPITPKPDGQSDEKSSDSECNENEKRKEKFDIIPDDIDEELVAIHEGADHAKLVEIYAQMQLKQQLAAEQKQNYPQLVAVGEDGYAEEENAYEEKHVPPSHYDQDVTDHALDCAAEAAATAAVNALGSAEPAEALAILEEWHWKESANEESSLAKTFPDLGYFEAAHDFHTSSDYVMSTGSGPTSQSVLHMPDSKCPTSTSWSVDDGSSIEQNFEYDSLKQIWIKTENSIEGEKGLYTTNTEQSKQFEATNSFFLDQSLFMGNKGNIETQDIGLSPIPVSSIPYGVSTRSDAENLQSKIERDEEENDDGIGDPLDSPSRAPFEGISTKYFSEDISQQFQVGRKEPIREEHSPPISAQHWRQDTNKSSFLANTGQDSSWNQIWSNKADDDDGIHITHEPTLFDQRDLVLQEDYGTASSSEKDYLHGYLKICGNDQSLVNPG